MARTIWLYGLAAGGLVVASIAIGIMLGTDGGAGGMMIGYLIMLVALSLIFIAIKRHRDHVQGGVIRFTTAFGIGLGISIVASATYVAGWEVYLWSTGYTFIEDYAMATLKAQVADGASSADIAALRASLEDMKTLYANPVTRMGVTFIEILPVGMLVSLVSAALLRNSGFLPVRHVA
jgi:hypothetical protein